MMALLISALLFFLLLFKLVIHFEVNRKKIVLLVFPKFKKYMLKIKEVKIQGSFKILKWHACVMNGTSILIAKYRLISIIEIALK